MTLIYLQFPPTYSQIFQSLFVSTGCDYISFVSENGKATFYRYFYQNAEFITSGTTVPGTLEDIELENNQYDLGFLAFIRLVGSTYFRKKQNRIFTIYS